MKRIAFLTFCAMAPSIAAPTPTPLYTLHEWGTFTTEGFSQVPGQNPWQNDRYFPAYEHRVRQLKRILEIGPVAKQ